MATTAIYAGSFDPITRGHEDLIDRSCEFVDHLVVAVAVNSSKKALFTTDERVKLIRATTAGNKCVEVTQFEGLLVDFARKLGAKFNIRGLRAVSDFEYEFQMALMNRHMSESFETIFMVPSVETTYISSSVVREVAQHHGNLNGLVHPAVAKALTKKFENTPPRTKRSDVR
ncbi:MAG TPA: pantetheine-phosphate adenylyltransferase [Gemmatimonadaceae bacterium]|nr:pantetheine-phosphate adenylyltransferase [Gemmatimonadaceae bacterium]